MSYNGIGLSTTRGSGTNGYIQKNSARVSESTYRRRQHHKRQAEKLTQIVKDKDLVLNKLRNKKREIELKISELRDDLEDEGIDEEDIEKRCDALREELTRPEPKPSAQRKAEKKEPTELDY
jgi:chromosome segregation ATPase